MSPICVFFLPLIHEKIEKEICMYKEYISIWSIPEHLLNFFLPFLIQSRRRNLYGNKITAVFLFKGLFAFSICPVLKSVIKIMDLTFHLELSSTQQPHGIFENRTYQENKFSGTCIKQTRCSQGCSKITFVFH